MSKKKKLNKEIRLRYEKEKQIAENPDMCFCDETEYDESKPIMIMNYELKNPFSLPI